MYNVIRKRAMRDHRTVMTCINESAGAQYSWVMRMVKEGSAIRVKSQIRAKPSNIE